MTRILALLLTALLPALAAAQETPEALVKRVTDEVLAIIKNDKDIQAGNTTKVAQLAEQKVLPHFDFERMTRLAVGKNWRDATDAQKKTLEDEFRTLLVRTYSSSLAAYRNQAIEVKPGTDGRRGQGIRGEDRGDPAGRAADPHQLLDGEDRFGLEGVRHRDRRRLAS